MDPIALLFPGQGAQFVGMGKELFEQSQDARAIFVRADEILGVHLSGICFQGPESALTQTSCCQPGIFVHSMATLAMLRASKPNFQFQVAAGLSLGEFTALTAAGWMKFEDGLRTVQERGRLMQQACEQTQGAMASIMGMDVQLLRDVCTESDVDLANLNCPGQIVISGEKSNIGKAIELAKTRGAKRAIPLTVAGAYHSRLMKPAADRLRSYLLNLDFQSSTIPVISNVTTLPHAKENLIENLVKQVTSSVCWEDSMRYLISKGFRKFIELGPGEVLAGLMKRIDRNIQVVSLGKPADFEKLSVIGI